VTLSEQFSLFPEGGDQLGSAAHPAQAPAAQSTEFGQILGAKVGQFMLFEMSPDVFCRVT
jgi:hypothetical protein